MRQMSSPALILYRGISRSGRTSVAKRNGQRCLASCGNSGGWHRVSPPKKESAHHDDRRSLMGVRWFSTEKPAPEDESAEKFSKTDLFVEYQQDDPEPLYGANENATEAGIDMSLFTETVEIRMPDMGEGEGKVLKWFKREGDIINRGDQLCDIQTPDFTFGMDTDDEGITIMGEIIVPAGSDAVADDALICTVLHKKEPKEEEKL